MTLTDREELCREVSFIGYYFHWPEEQILKMSHPKRRRYCEEINCINRKINGENNMFRL